MRKEIWKNIKEFENIYQISNYGNIRNIKKHKLMKPFISKKTGYYQIDLCKNGCKKRYSIHRLVAETFILNSNNLPQVNHKNEIKIDNRVENLEWCTHKYNSNYGTIKQRIGLKSSQRKHSEEAKQKISKALSKPIIQYSKDNTFIKEWNSAYEVKRNLGITVSNINDCCNNKRKTASGYIWKFKKEVNK